MSWTTERARVASLSRSREPDDPDLVAAREALKASRFEEQIRRLVDGAPPLSDGQRDRLVALLLRAPAPLEADQLLTPGPTARAS